MSDPSIKAETELSSKGEVRVHALSEAVQGLSGTRLREWILDLPNPQQVVQGLAATDFFWLVKKVGPEDSLPLLEMASNDQWGHLLDLEVWRRDRVALDATGAWLRRLHKADGERLAKWLTEEGELLGRFYLSRLLDVTVRDHETESVPEGFFTLDGVYYLRVRDPGQQEWVQELMADMARLDYQAYLRVLLGLAERLPSDMEEELYRFRSARLAECGFLPFEEALTVYSPLEPEELLEGSPQVPAVIDLDDEQAEQVPMIPLDQGLAEGLLARAVEGIEDPLVRDRLRLEFAALANQLVSAEGMPVMDVETLAWACKRAASYLNLGLERLARDDTGRAGRLVEERALVSIFRVGFGIAVRLQREARKWVRGSWFRRVGLSFGFWGEAWGGLLAGILRPRPLYSTGGHEAGQYRDFRRLVEVEEAARTLARLQALDALLGALAERYPLDPALVASPEATFHPLLFNLWGREVLGLTLRTAPLGMEEVRELFRILRKGDRRRPYSMPGFQERFLGFFLGHAPAESHGTLRVALSMIWREFREEHERLPVEELDARFLRFIHLAS